MTRFLLSAILLVSFLCQKGFSDRVILSPTGDVLESGQFKLEGVYRFSDERPNILWLQAGIWRTELQISRYDFGNGRREVTYGAELAVLPETYLTPSFGIGVLDVSDEGPGRAGYIAASKAIPSARFLWIEDLRLHAGLGAGSIKGVFAGADLKLKNDIGFSAEYDSKHINYSIKWMPLRGLSVSFCSLDGEAYFGASYNFGK